MLTKYLGRATLLASISSIVVLASPSALAQADEAEGNVSQAGAVELTFDHAQSGQDVLAATIEYGLGVRLADGWTVHLDAVVEPVEDPLTDVAFHAEDAYIETLSLQYSGDNFSLYAGKIDPVFGSAADLASGLYGAEIGEAYQITEQVGVGGDISLSSLLGLDGDNVLSAAVFTADRSFLSGSLGGRRNRVLLSDGGLANTSDLKSYAVSLDGSFENGFGYSVGYRHLASDTVGESDESMTVAGVSYAFPEDLGFGLDTMAEVGMSRDADGIDGANRDFYTVAAEIGLGDWFVNVVASGWNENDVAGDLDLRKFEVSIGRDLADNLTLEFGAQDAHFGDDSETILGLRLSYSFG